MPHELGLPVQEGPSVAPGDEAKTDNFFESFGEPQ
jgi:hypothetical protein